jgi:phosphate ABC transporter phosphate-binding protein
MDQIFSSQRQCLFALRRISTVLLGCSFFFLTSVFPVYCQSSESLSQVRKLYVAPLGDDSEAIAARRDLIRRLQKGSEIKIAANAGEADATLKGTARIWVVGYTSLNPRSQHPVAPIREGFLSVEVISKNNQTLWSYLVTPGKFPWNGVADDLAKQIVARLIGAIHESTHEEPSTSSGSAASLKGAGATFPAPLYQKWFELFEEEHPAIHIHYDAVGSAEGIRQLRQGQIDFGASEMPLSDDSQPPSSHRFVEFPVVLGAVVPIYNLQGLHRTLNFTPEALAGIYLGKVKKWNDPQIKSANPGAALPDARITVIHRADGSGTTFVWSDYLSKVSAEWKSSAGKGVTLQWPVGEGAQQNEGVASAVQQTPNSIGYVEFIYALQHQLSFGAVRNARGEFVKADIASVMAAADASSNPDTEFRLSITDSRGRTAYPIATYTWLLTPEQIGDGGQKTALTDLLRWMLTSGQKSCSALGYAPLPTEIARRALQSVDRIH